jgi:hypothetical protein
MKSHLFESFEKAFAVQAGFQIRIDLTGSGSGLFV